MKTKIKFLIHVHHLGFGVSLLLGIYERLKFGDGKVDSKELLHAIDFINSQQSALLSLLDEAEPASALKEESQIKKVL